MRKTVFASAISLAVLLAISFLAVLACTGASGVPTIALSYTDQEAGALSNNSVITIGVAADLSGWVPDLGWPQANAVQLAVSQTNAAGGIDLGGVTYTLNLAMADSMCDGSQAVTAANTLLNGGAVAVVGHTCSSASLSAQPIYDMAGVPMVAPSSTAIDLTEQGYSTTFRTGSRDDAAAVWMATYFHQSLGMDAVAIVEWSDSQGASDAFANTFAGLGGTITSRHTVTATDQYTATLTAIQAEDPDTVFYAADDAYRCYLLC
jgi:branched-chain amino acid transport system substrate-binding protein